jgi:DNA-binding SARP family transcriptional activator/tetratricopeptide (TPR) repeat protein
MARESTADSATDADVVVHLVGPFTVVRRGHHVATADLGSRKARLLLKILSAEPGRTVSVADLVDLLWAGEKAPRQPADNVATLVSRLRRALGADVLSGSRETGYRLGNAPSVVVDVDAAQSWVDVAETRLAAGEAGLASAAAARAMDLLTAEVALEDEPDAPWAQPVRERLIALLRNAKHVSAAAALEAGDAGSASVTAQSALADDPYDEIAVRLVMRALAALGEPSRALTVYADLRQRLVDELGADPAPETRELHAALLREEPPVTPARPGSDVGPESLGLVGRAAELRVLRSRWNAAAAGTGALVLLVGEAGIGKTRLAEELAALAASTGGTVLHARCHEAERSLFLQPVVDAVSAAVSGLPPEVSRAAAGADAAVLANLVPSAALVLGPATAGRSSVQVERTRTFQAVTGFVRGLARRGPVLLSLDDLHLAGRETIELLYYLARHCAASRVLVLATVRGEEGRDAIALLGEAAMPIEVPPLSPDAVLRLAEAAGRADLAESIHRRTAGHALSVVETLRALAGGEPGVPKSLQAALLARVRRAGPGVEELLQAGAVVGGTFDPAIVARLLGEPLPAVLTRGADALAARLLVESGRDFEFVNDLVREVFYDVTPAPLRAAFHAQAADLLTDRPETVALHAIAIEDWSRAARALLLAGEQALARYAAGDAEDLLTRSLDAADQAGDRDIRGRALLARGHAREARASYVAALADLEEAVVVAREIGDQRLEMLALRAFSGEVQIALGQATDEVKSHLAQCLRLAATLGDRAMESDVLGWLAVLSSNALRFDEAVDYGRLAVDAGRASGDDEALMVALDGRKTSLAYLGEIAELEPVLAELEPLVRRLGDPNRLHWVIFESGFPALAAGDWSTAAERFETALETCRRNGQLAYETWHLAHLGWLARLQGEDQRALELGRAAVERSADLPHAWCGALAAALLGTTLLELGRRDEAVAVLERGRGLAEEEGSQAYLLRCLAPLAEANGSAQTLAEADALLRQVVTPSGSAWIAGDFTYLCIARAWLAAGQPQRARDVLAPMLAVAERVPWVGPLAEGSLVDARAAAALGRAEEAERLLGRARTVAGRYGLTHTADAARHGLAAG